MERTKSSDATKKAQRKPDNPDVIRLGELEDRVGFHLRRVEAQGGGALVARAHERGLGGDTVCRFEMDYYASMKNSGDYLVFGDLRFTKKLGGALHGNVGAMVVANKPKAPGGVAQTTTFYLTLGYRF